MKEQNTFSVKELDRIHEKCLRPSIVKFFLTNGYKYNEYDIQEVVSEAYLKILHSKDKYDEGISCSSWFSAIAWNCACDYIKREKRWNDYHSSIDDGDDDTMCIKAEYSAIEDAECYHTDYSLLSKERKDVIEGVINSLGADDALVLKLKAMDYSNEEIQSALGLGGAACRTRICRARRKFKENAEIRGICREVLGRGYTDAA